MVDPEHRDENGFFTQLLGSCLAERVSVARKSLKSQLKRERRVCVEYVYAVIDGHAKLRQVASYQPPVHRAAAESVCELSCESILQLLIGRRRKVRKVDLDSCSFGQRQRSAPCAPETPPFARVIPPALAWRALAGV